MGKIVSKIKNSIGSISWPSKKEVVSDTIFTIIVAAVFSTLILLWTGCIDTLVDWIVSFF